MPRHVVNIEETINAPREKVFAFFADHQKFASLFGGGCKRTKDGQGDPNGLGSVRTIGSGLLGFDETIVKFDKPNTIHYQITRGSPLKNHLGTIEFKDLGDRTKVYYQIVFDGKFPLIGHLVKFALAKAWASKAPAALAKIS